MIPFIQTAATIVGAVLIAFGALFFCYFVGVCIAYFVKNALEPVVTNAELHCNRLDDIASSVEGFLKSTKIDWVRLERIDYFKNDNGGYTIELEWK